MTEEFDHMHCRECDIALSLEEVLKSGEICLVCGKETSWRSDPIYFGDEE